MVKLLALSALVLVFAAALPAEAHAIPALLVLQTAVLSFLHALPLAITAPIIGSIGLTAAAQGIAAGLIAGGPCGKPLCRA